MIRFLPRCASLSGRCSTDALRFAPSLQTGLVLVALMLLSACGSPGRGNAPDVAEGHFRLEAEGGTETTLDGTARLRVDDEGRLVGLELDQENDSLAGISFEMEPHPLDLTMYEVVPPALFSVDRPDSPPGLTAYLETGQGSFTAEEGSLRIGYIDDDGAGGTFELIMDGVPYGTNDPVSIIVEGAFWAESP